MNLKIKFLLLLSFMLINLIPFVNATNFHVDLSGIWLSDQVDDMTIRQTGNRITGTYQYKNDSGVIKHGEIEGVINGKTINGKWWEYPSREGGKVGEESQGDWEWNISDDGKMLRGWYREDGERDYGEPEKHEWYLER